MNKVLNFLKVIFLVQNNDNIKVGLTQFKPVDIVPPPKEVSIRTKDVKLSDLMRRVG